MEQAVPPAELIEYAKQMRAQGFSQDDVQSKLLQAGWSADAVDSLITYLYVPIGQSVATDTLEVPHATTTITNKNYPVAMLWAFRRAILVLGIILLMLIFGYYSIELLLVFPVILIADPYLRARFSYEITNDGVNTFNGKSYETAKRKHQLLFANVQSIEVQRGVLNTILGIADVTVHTEAGEPRTGLWANLTTLRTNKCPILVGTLVPSPKCPQVTIPGLSYQHALIVEGILRDRCQPPTSSPAFTHQPQAI